MKKIKPHKSGPIRTLHDLRYEKAKLKLEIMNMEENIQSDIHSWFHGGFIHSATSGFNVFSTVDKIASYWGVLQKSIQWGKKFVQKFQHKNKAKAE